MKNKTWTRRALSLLLCAVMLCSGLVFSAPGSAAATTFYDGNSTTYGDSTRTTGTTAISSSRNGKYRVRILLREVKQMDKTIHDNDTYVAGLTYGTSTSQSKRNLNGGMNCTEFRQRQDDKNASGSNNSSNATSGYDYWCEYAQITYKTMNGTSEGQTGYCWFNLGDNSSEYSDVISGGGHNYGYYPSKDGVVIDGFPTACYTRFVDVQKNSIWEGASTLKYYAYLQVARWTSDTEWTWDDMGGTCENGAGLSGGWDDSYAGGVAGGSYSGTSIKGKAVECRIDLDFTVKKMNKDSMAVTEYNLYTSPYACSNQSTGAAYTTSASATKSVSLTSSSSSSTALSERSCPKTSGTTNSCYLYYTSPPRDQYGTYMAAKIQIHASNNNKKTYFTFDSSNKRTIKISYNCNIDGGGDANNQQSIKVSITWPQENTSENHYQVSGTTAELTIKDAKYNVRYYDASGQTFIKNPSNPTANYVDSVYYGDDGVAPDASTYAKEYDSTNHYVFNGWSPVNTNIKADKDCTPQYDTVAHTLVNDNSLPGYAAPTCTENGTQTKRCSADCGYTTSVTISALTHDYNAEKTTATCTAEGYITYTCQRDGCGYSYTAYPYTENGTESDDDVTYKPLGHDISAEYATDGTYHWRTCNNGCGTLFDDNGDSGKSVHSFTDNTIRDDSTRITQETCVQTGEYYYTCSTCGSVSDTYTYTVETTAHNWGTEPLSAGMNDARDGTGYVYYKCSGCDRCCPAVYDAEEGAYEVNDEVIVASPEALESESVALDMVPTPFFNDDRAAAMFYYLDYSERQASLRFDLEENYQGLRFCGSVKIPAGVSYQINPTANAEDVDNAVLDFGFVWTQTRFICDDYRLSHDAFGDPIDSTADPSKLVFTGGSDGKPTAASGEEGYQIYQTSVVRNNASRGTMDASASNWSGVTINERDTNSGNPSHYYSFNLVINVTNGIKNGKTVNNWAKEYSARPYIIYKYHGQVYTVYDAGTSAGISKETYSHRSVNSVANTIMRREPFFDKTDSCYYENMVAAGATYEQYLTQVHAILRDKQYIYDKFYSDMSEEEFETYCYDPSIGRDWWSAKFLAEDIVSRETYYS